MNNSGLAIVLLLIVTGSAHAQPGYTFVDSLDSMVMNADHVFIGKVKEFKEDDRDVRPRGYQVVFEVQESLKIKDPLIPREVELVLLSAGPADLAKWKTQGSRVLVASDWESNRNSKFIDLEAEHSNTLTAGFQHLPDGDTITRVAKEIIASAPAHVKRIHTFELKVPESIRAKMSIIEHAIFLRVPVDKRLEKKAQILMRSKVPHERTVGLRAIRYFKTKDNIATTRDLLADPFKQRHHSTKHQYDVYVVRKEAWNNFLVWGVEADKPILREDVED